MPRRTGDKRWDPRISIYTPEDEDQRDLMRLTLDELPTISASYIGACALEFWAVNAFTHGFDMKNNLQPKSLVPLKDYDKAKAKLLLDFRKKKK